MVWEVDGGCEVVEEGGDGGHGYEGGGGCEEQM
mgnify:CR=1 FL=1